MVGASLAWSGKERAFCVADAVDPPWKMGSLLIESYHILALWFWSRNQAVRKLHVSGIHILGHSSDGRRRTPVGKGDAGKESKEGIWVQLEVRG
jgi:hypothetical protein